MASYTCLKTGCVSSDPDWCSECGAGMHPVARGVTSAPAAEAAPMLCPACGTPRENNGRFCGVCRYNFETGQPYAAGAAATPKNAATGSKPIAVAPAALPSPAARSTSIPASAPLDPAIAVVGATAPTTPWAVLIDFDPTVDPTATPDISVPRPRLTFPLDLPELLIGRAGSKSHPEIPIEDEGVSARHAKIVFTADSQPFLLELGSTNGTRVNGAAATAGLPLPLKSGDQIVIGRWTRMTIKTS